MVREKIFGLDSIYYINGSQTLPPPLKKAEEQIVAYSAVRFLFTAFTAPGLISKKVLTDMKTIALDYCRHIEPLCFQ